MKYCNKLVLMVCFSFVLLIIQKTTFKAKIFIKQEISGKVTDASDGSSLFHLNVIVKRNPIQTRATNAKGDYTIIGTRLPLIHFLFLISVIKLQMVRVEGQSIINENWSLKRLLASRRCLSVGYQTERKSRFS